MSLRGGHSFLVRFLLLALSALGRGVLFVLVGSGGCAVVVFSCFRVVRVHFDLRDSCVGWNSRNYFLLIKLL